MTGNPSPSVPLPAGGDGEVSSHCIVLQQSEVSGGAYLTPSIPLSDFGEGEVPVGRWLLNPVRWSDSTFVRAGGAGR